MTGLVAILIIIPVAVVKPAVMKIAVPAADTTMMINLQEDHQEAVHRTIGKMRAVVVNAAATVAATRAPHGQHKKELQHLLQEEAVVLKKHPQVKAPGARKDN